MKLSVIIPCYNFESYLDKCIQSVLEQETNFDYEIIVGDDCSSDSSATILSNYIGRISYYVNQNNFGYGENTVKLISLCRGEYITYLDGDDFLTDNQKFQKQIDFLDANPEYVMHSTGCFYATPEGEFSGTIITPVIEEPTTEELLSTNYVGFGRTFRNIKNISFEWMKDIKFHDWAINFELSLLGKIRCENFVSGGYRISGNGIITSLDDGDIYNHNQICMEKLAYRLNDFKNKN